MQEYQILHNGGHPFSVKINNNDITISKCDGYDSFDDTSINYTEILRIDNCKQIFVGKDIRINGVWTLMLDKESRKISGIKVSDNYEREDGNSILINTKDRKYVYIGTEIFEFETTDDIIDYYSPIGNSDVPYPFAIGTKYTYLMLEHRYIQNTYVRHQLDPYRHFYRLSNIVSGLKYINDYPNDPLSNIDTDDERKYFNIPVGTDEDEKKYVEYRTKRFNISNKHIKQYDRYKYFARTTLFSVFLGM